MRPLEKVYWLRLALGLMAALICTGYVFATGSVARNLIPNSSVEEGAAGIPDHWTGSGTGAEWNATSARTGSRSLGLDVFNDSAEWRSDALTIGEGSTCTVIGFISGEVKANETFFLAVRWFSDTAGLRDITEDRISISAGNYSQWWQLRGTFTAPIGTKSFEIMFKAVNGSGDLRCDDLRAEPPENISTFFNGISIALIVYLLSYYIIKSKFKALVQKPQKLVTTGIGVYMLSWLVFWILLYTMIVL